MSFEDERGGWAAPSDTPPSHLSPLDQVRIKNLFREMHYMAMVSMGLNPRNFTVEDLITALERVRDTLVEVLAQDSEKTAQLEQYEAIFRGLGQLFNKIDDARKVTDHDQDGNRHG